MSAWIKDGVAFCPCCNNNYDTNDYVSFTPKQAAMYAAAPELLAALQLLHPKQDVWRTPTDAEAAQIENIIAKATGKPA